MLPEARRLTRNGAAGKSSKVMRPVLLLLVLLELASAPLSAGDFEFVVIGDTRPRFESESFRPFESLITKDQRSKPALVVNLGDLIYGYGPASKEKQWDKYAGGHQGHSSSLLPGAGKP